MRSVALLWVVLAFVLAVAPAPVQAHHLTCDGQVTTIDGTAGDDNLTGTAGVDVVNLQGGKDRFSGSGGNDVICGGEGDDTLIGDGGDDRIFGQGGDDDLDTACVRDPTGGEAQCSVSPGTGPGDDTLEGGPGADILFATAGSDTLSGGDDADVLRSIDSFGDVAPDTLNGDGGADRIVGASAGPAVVNGGSGRDTVTLGNFAGTVNGGPDGDAIRGGGAGDQLNGEADGDYIEGGGGNDTIRGGDGVDNLDGQGGNDDVQGGADADRINGSAGTDTLAGGTGGIELDRLQYSSTDGAEVPVVPPSAGVQIDLTTGQAGGGDGTDTFSGFEVYHGSDRADTMIGDGNDNTLFGAGGADTLEGGGGSDYLAGQAGGDTVRGGTGDDLINERDANSGDDHLFGDAGKDNIDSYHGNDEVDGGADDDTLLGGAGNDSYAGGSGTDLFETDGETTVDLQAGTASGAGTDTIAGVEDLLGGGGPQTLLGDGGPNRLRGGPGDDTLDGRGGGDVVEGECGADRVNGGPGADLLHGDLGDFGLCGGGAAYSADAFDGGPGTDTLEFPNFLFGPKGVNVDLAAGTATGEGNDTVAGVENVNGTPFPDTLKGDGAANRLVSYLPTIPGFDGDDLVDGRGGVDHQDCGLGDDIGYRDRPEDTLISCDEVRQGSTPVPVPPGPGPGTGTPGPSPPGGPAAAGPGAPSGGSSPSPTALPLIVAGCLNADAKASGRTLGPAQLGRTRTAQRARFKGAKLNDVRGLDRYCALGGGAFRIGYPTNRLLAALKGGVRRKVKGRVVLLQTSSPRFQVRGVRVGDTAKRAAAALRGERRVRVGSNEWLLAPGGGARLLVVIRGGRVRAVGIGDSRLTGSGKVTQRFLRAWQLG